MARHGPKRGRRRPPPIPALNLVVAELSRTYHYAAIQSLAGTCKECAKHYHLLAISLLLRRHLASTYPIRVFFLADAKSGEPGYAPFIIHDVVVSEDSLKLVIAYPECAMFLETVPTSSYLFINRCEEDVPRGSIWMNEHYTAKLDEYQEGCFVTRGLDGDYWDRNPPSSILRVRSPFERDKEVNGAELDWRKIGGRLVPASPTMLRSRFDCPECSGSYTFDLVGESAVVRWPALVHLIQNVPEGLECVCGCPRCGGYKWAAISSPQYGVYYDEQRADFSDDESYYYDCL